MAAIALSVAAGSVAARENWRQIGNVSYEVPHQKAVITVGAADGRFEALRLQVSMAASRHCACR